MKLEYFADTDSLSVDFRDQPSVESTEISAGIVVDFDADGRVVGIDIAGPESPGFKPADYKRLFERARRRGSCGRVIEGRIEGTSVKCVRSALTPAGVAA